MTNITDEQLSNAAALVKSITGKDYFAAFNTHPDRVLEIFARAYEHESERSKTILKQSITISKILNENAILKQERYESYSVADKIKIAELEKEVSELRADAEFIASYLAQAKKGHGNG